MELNYKVFGQGLPVIILHGLFGSLDNWQTIARKIAESYTVFTIDQRNHGKSPHSDEINYPLLAEDLRSWMDSNHIYSAYLIGHSMGGKTVMQFALDNPDMVDKLIVVDMSPARYPSGHDVIFDALLSVDLSHSQSRDQIDEHLGKAIPQLSVRQFLMKNLARTPEGGFQWKFNLDALHHHYDEILAPIEGPGKFDKETLFIRGEKSSYINDENETAIKEHFSNYRIKTIERAGHWIHAEAPEAFTRVVTEFLK